MNLIDKTIDALGPITITSRERLKVLLKNPSERAWEHARFVVLNREGLTLKDACGGSYRCPTHFMILRALQKVGINEKSTHSDK